MTMDFYQTAAQDILNGIADHKLGKLDSASLHARATATRAAAAMLKAGTDDARHTGQLDLLKPIVAKRLASA